MADKTIAIKVDLKGTETQKKKLAGLETEVKKLTNRRTQLNKALKDGTINTKQYGRAIAKVNTGLKAHRRELLVTRQEMLNIDGFTTRLGKSFGKMGTSIVAGFAGMFAVQQVFQVIKSGIKILEDFEQQMAKVKAVTGATEIEFKFLTESAKELGRTSLFTSSEVGQLQEELAKLGFTTPQILQSSEAILQLATATGSDLAQSSAVAASTLNAFGLEAKQAQDIVDLMAESFSSTPLDIDKFQESMKLVAPTAKSVGVSVQETTAQLGLLAKNGISGSIAGTQLSRVFIELNKKGISLQDAMEQVSSSSNKLGTATELVGDRGAKALQIFADQSGELEILKENFKDSAGEAEKMADIVGNTSVGATKKLNSAYEGLILTIGDGGEDALTKVKLFATDLLNTFTEVNTSINRLKDAGQNSIGLSFGFVSDDQQAFLDALDKNNEFLKDNIDNADALKQKRVEVAQELLFLNNRIKQAQEDGDDDLAEAFTKRAEIQFKFFKDIKAQQEELKKVEAVTISETLKAEEDAAKQLSTAEKKEAEKAVKEKLKIKEKEISEAKKIQDAIDKATKKSISNKEKLELDALNIKKISALDNEREIEDAKLNIAREAAKKQVDLTKATETAKEQEKIAIDAKFKAQANALELTRKEEDKVKDDEQKAKDLEAKAAFALQVKKQSLDIAANTANALVEVSNRRFEREKTLELAALDSKLEQGLISQEEFEKEREAIERKGFNRQKKMDLALIAISLAKEIAAINMNAAANPANIGTAGLFGLTQAATLTGLAIANSAVQAGVVSSQKFADGGYTGSGFGSPDSSGFKQAGVVHEGEYVVPKNVLESQRGSNLVGALESMRTNRPQPFSNFGFANGGLTGASSLNMVDLENKISKAVANSVGTIQVVNNATDTISQAAKVSNIQSEATFG